jgi:hypothetical protein
MIRKTISIEIAANTQTELAQIEKAMAVYIKTFSAKEHDKLRMILLYDTNLLSMLRQKLNT